jgi:hypothetical protein
MIANRAMLRLVLPCLVTLVALAGVAAAQTERDRALIAAAHDCW